MKLGRETHPSACSTWHVYTALNLRLVTDYECQDVNAMG
jgi:hypothetical protein